MTIEENIEVIRGFVPRLRDLIGDFTPEQLTTPYNAPEWTIAQNVHHLADAHLNSYTRFKLILTEERPQLRRWQADPFASLPDAQDADISASMTILEGLHARWAIMLDNITDWDKAGFFSGRDKDTSLMDLLVGYANHCNAHYQQIQAVIAKMDS